MASQTSSRSVHPNDAPLVYGQPAVPLLHKKVGCKTGSALCSIRAKPVQDLGVFFGHRIWCTGRPWQLHSWWSQNRAAICLTRPSSMGVDHDERDTLQTTAMQHVLYAINFKSQKLCTNAMGSVQRATPSESFQSTTGSQRDCCLSARAIDLPSLPNSRVSAPAARCDVPACVYTWPDGRMLGSVSV